MGLGEINRALELYMTNAGMLGGTYARGFPPGLGHPLNKLASPVTSHNSILTIWAEQGSIGAFLFIGALVALLIHLFRVRARAPVEGVLCKDLLSLLIIAIIGHFISTMGYDIRFFKYPSYVLWMLYALGVRFGEILNEKQHDATASAASSSLVESFPSDGVLAGAAR